VVEDLPEAEATAPADALYQASEGYRQRGRAVPLRQERVRGGACRGGQDYRLPIGSFSGTWAVEGSVCSPGRGGGSSRASAARSVRLKTV
jgi:hypothetical protein